MLGWYCPNPQPVHAEAASDEYVPAAHGSPVDWPVDAQNEPDGHAEHEVAPVDAPKKPEPHAMHPTEPMSTVNSPAEQLEHALAPTAAAYLPAAHGPVGAGSPDVAQKLPIGQLTHAIEL